MTVARLLALTLLCIAGSGLLRPATACSCNENPPCAAVWRADAVFVGTVTEQLSERIGGSLSWTVHRVAVEQPLRGAVGSSLTLVPDIRVTAEEIAASRSREAESLMMSTCEYGFRVGGKYVIYARRTADGRWTTSQCAGTKRFSEASADIAYIAGLSRRRPTGHVYGTVEQAVVDPRNPAERNAVPAARVQVALTRGAYRVTVTTDSSGRFNAHVPPGEYSIRPVVPPDVHVHGSTDSTLVPARGCAPVRFWLETTNR